MKKTSTLAATVLALTACASGTDSRTRQSTPKVGLANPASVFCMQQGGKLRSVQTAQGEHVMCMLADGREVEEWAYFRQHQPAKP